MKRVVYSKDAQVVDREVIGFLSIFINLVVPDEEAIAASLTSTSYPGRDAFLQDVADILTQEKGCIILDKHNSNNKKSNSPSVYFVLEYPLSATKSIICTIYLRVSNHRSNDSSFFSLDYVKHVEQIRKKYLSPNSSIFDSIQIITEMETPLAYQDSLNDIRTQFDEAMQNLRVRYHSLLK